MIPRRIKLKGFLCYKEEQEIGFDGPATLWMLSGLNGSGKSSIFDAVTYALFGHHRGGGRDYHELINKDSDSLVVEFDFQLDGRDYRAKRTLKRDTRGGARSTQQMFRYEGANGAGKWEAIEGTGQKGEFSSWVKSFIGLEYETFTSSVLLLQGKAEKLLDSTPSGRREVLASIVDLSRYERLHQKADEKRKSLDGSLKTLTSRLDAVPDIAPLELVAARTHIAEAEETRDAARAEVERLIKAESEAKTYQELRQRLEQGRTRWLRAKNVLAEAASIERAVERLRELREVYPRLREIAVLRGQSSQAEDLISRLTAERQRQADDHSAREAALRQAREKRTTIQNQVARDELTYREASQHLSAAKVKMERLKECERHESDLARLRADIKTLPADPQGMLGLARDEYEKLEAFARVVPLLVRFATRRVELSKAVEQEKAVEKQLQELRAKAEGRKAEAEALRPKLEAATTAHQRASEQATEARTLLSQAKQSLQDLEHVGEKVCRHCGQQLTEGHIADEKKRRSKEVKLAEARSRAADEALAAARKDEQELRQKLESADRFVQQSREEYRDGMNHQKQARAAVERLQGECATHHADLPDDFRRKVCTAIPSDWLTTSYPAQTDIDYSKAKANGAESAKRKKNEAEETVRKYDQLKARESAALENLNRLMRDLPGDRQTIRKEYADLEAQAKALFGSIDAGRAQSNQIEKEVEKLTRDRDQAQGRIQETDGKLQTQNLTMQNAQRGMANETRNLPESWRGQADRIGIKDLSVYQDEQNQLEREGTDDRARELEGARHNLSELEKDVKALEAKEATFAPEAKENVASIEKRIKEAKLTDRMRDDELSQARKQLGMLESYEQQRSQLNAEYKSTEKEYTTYKLLCELLGRDRLQLFLVRQAEKQVVEYANAVLDRLSGGQLYLRLSGEAGGEGSTAKALELEAYNRATGERPINVAFLSGSQKFRVAVSLALGIGQYASRQHRPIESVIIDEGFGCLDSQGRQVMIQELQNLRSQMRCILLVSHQEDFAEAFADGYHFELEQGATRVKRIQK